MKVRWHEEALHEYGQLLVEAGERNALERANIKKRVLETLRNLRDFPSMGRFNTEVECYEKYVPRTRVLLIYQLVEQHIRIIAAFHTSREPEEKPFERRHDEL